MTDCLVCNRIDLVKQGQNKYFVKELETGYVVMADSQFYMGYTIFLSKVHARELHDLESSFMKKFLLEMALVAEAVIQTFEPNKLNYELLGNTDEHVHWHLIPRRVTDPKPQTAIWALDENSRFRAPVDSELTKSITSLEETINSLNTKNVRS